MKNWAWGIVVFVVIALGVYWVAEDDAPDYGVLGTQTFTSDEYGFSFKYPPEYVPIGREIGNDERLNYKTDGLYTFNYFASTTSQYLILGFAEGHDGASLDKNTEVLTEVLETFTHATTTP